MSGTVTPQPAWMATNSASSRSIWQTSKKRPCLPHEYCTRFTPPMKSAGTVSFQRPRSASRWLPPNGADAEQLVTNADIALYNAKLENTGSWRFFEPEMGVRVQQRRALEAELEGALERSEFELFYPALLLVALETCAFEALVRWRNPIARPRCAWISLSVSPKKPD